MLQLVVDDVQIAQAQESQLNLLAPRVLVAKIFLTTKG